MLVENNGFPWDPRVAKEARTLLRAGYKVSVICPRLRGEKLYEVIDGIAVYRFPMAPQPKGPWGYIWEYSYSLAVMFLASLVVFVREGFDVIHTQNPPDVLFAIGLFYRLFGKKFIFDHNDPVPELYLSRFTKRKLVFSILLLLERLSCRFAEVVVAAGAGCEELEIARDRVPPRKITVVRNLPNLEHIKALPLNSAPRTNGGKVTLGYVGALGPQDGVHLLLKSLYHLAYNLGRPDFHCLIIGYGEMLNTLKQTAREMAIDRFVTFTGRLPWEEAMKSLSAVDICLEPNPSSPFNDKATTVKAFEYMALQKPIVAYDLPAQHSVIQGAALFARSNDEVEFAAKIAQLMDDRELRESMGAAGRHKIENGLTWEHSAANKLLQAYQDLIRRPDRA